MNTSDRDHDDRDDEVLEALFRHVSSRQRPPREVEQEIRESLHAEWAQQNRQRRVRKRTLSLAIAAAAILALFALTNTLRQPVNDGQRPMLATVEKSSGDVFVQGAAEQNSRLLESTKLHRGDVLSTIQAARIALSWSNGESVRIDQNSRVVLISKTEIELLSGSIYVDSAGAIIKGKAFRILTPSGPVTHIGTQYITTVAGADVTISVREGEVTIGSGRKKAVAMQGQKLHISEDGQQSISTIPIFGEDWQWTEQVAPGFDMEGRSLKELLDWVARETGRSVAYESTQSEIAAATTRLHGKLDIAPLRAMELMIQTSDLTAVLHDGVILVSL